jgi:ComF family protein
MVPAVVKRLIRAGCQALFPAKCLGCGGLFHHGTGPLPTVPADTQASATDFDAAMALHFCPDCRSQWTAVAPPLCSRCGLVFESREGEDHRCGRCLDRQDGFSRARAAGIYNATLQIAIHALKFKNKVCLAGPLGALLYDTLQTYWTAEDIDVVAPVPLHHRRFKKRGFNQAYLLMRQWPPFGETAIIRDLLVRIRATAPQTGLDRRQRRRNIKNAFAVRRPGQSANKRVLLVDDVLTTGATVDACANALIRDGAKRVDVLTLARAL